MSAGRLGAVWIWLLKQSRMMNRVAYQRGHWRRQLSIEQAERGDRIGFDWGDPEAVADKLGNYARVLSLLRTLITPESDVLEIGSYGGKWTRYLLPARRVVCVDLFRESFECIRRRFGNPPNVEFYQTRGDELTGVASASVDLVFTMDSLVRVPEPAIRRYLAESMRVLRPGGRILWHLPCSDIAFCRRKKFVAISKEWITGSVASAGFVDLDVDLTTLQHGALVSATKPTSPEEKPHA